LKHDLKYEFLPSWYYRAVGSGWKNWVENAMSWLLAVALFAIGWFLLDSGTQFIGFLAIIAGIFALVWPRSRQRPQPVQAAAPAGYYPPPVIVKAGHAPPLQAVKLRIKEPWPGTFNYEDFFSSLADVVLLPFKVLWRLLRSSGGKKK